MRNETKSNFVNWVKTHKRELILAGISITAIITIILGFRNRKQLMALWTSLLGMIRKDSKIMSPMTQTAERATEELLSTVEIPNPVQLTIVDANTADILPYEVRTHIRNLPEGWHPSASKIARAAENGIKLLPNQTWVENYMKGGTVA